MGYTAFSCAYVNHKIHKCPASCRRACGFFFLSRKVLARLCIGRTLGNVVALNETPLSGARVEVSDTFKTTLDLPNQDQYQSTWRD